MDSDNDDLPRNGVYNLALRQRWQTRRGPKGKKRNVDFLRFDASVTLVEHDIDNAVLPADFYFSTPEWQLDTRAMINTDLANFDLDRREVINPTHSDHAKAKWTWLISDTTAFIGSCNTNIHDGVLSQSDMAFAVQRTPRLGYYFGSRYLREGDPLNDIDDQTITTGDSNFITAGGSYRINRKYTVGVAHEFDIERGSAAYTQGVVIRAFPQWYGALSVSYDANRNSSSVSFSLWPKALDKLALGTRRYTRLAR